MGYLGTCWVCGSAIFETFALDHVVVGGIRRRVHAGACADRARVQAGPTIEGGGDMDRQAIATLIADYLRDRDDIAAADVTSTGTLVVVRTQGGADYSVLVTEGRPE